MSRKIAQQENLSDNFANLSEDMSQQVRDRKQLELDGQERGLIALQTADTGSLQSMWEADYFKDSPPAVKKAIENRLKELGRI
jgi:hypothetical protein